jgi:mRNA-degrading endonuclease toxin of MazEF toxin-antitoxin module
MPLDIAAAIARSNMITCRSGLRRFGQDLECRSEPTGRNGLSSASRLMIDKITTVPKARMGKRIGKLNDEDVVRLNRALTVFVGLAR